MSPTAWSLHGRIFRPVGKHKHLEFARGKIHLGGALKIIALAVLNRFHGDYVEFIQLAEVLVIDIVKSDLDVPVLEVYIVFITGTGIVLRVVAGSTRRPGIVHIAEGDV